MDSEFIADPAPMPVTDAFPRINLILVFLFYLSSDDGGLWLVRQLNKVVFQGHKLLAFPEVISATIARRKKGFNLFFPEFKCINMDFKHCRCQIKWTNQMDCILLTSPIGYFSIDKAKNLSFPFWIL